MTDTRKRINLTTPSITLLTVQSPVHNNKSVDSVFVVDLQLFGTVSASATADTLCDPLIPIYFRLEHDDIILSCTFSSPLLSGAITVSKK